jgi:hypothetical protein
MQGNAFRTASYFSEKRVVFPVMIAAVQERLPCCTIHQ